MTAPLPAPRGIPHLLQAIDLLAYDNGAVFRDGETIDEIKARVWWELREHYPLITLAEVELELSTLSASLPEEVCCGELMEPFPISDKTNEVLNFIFDHLTP